MVRASDEGLIAGVGLGKVSLGQLRRAADGTEIVCVQNMFRLADRGATPVLAECVSRDIEFVPFCRLAGRAARPNPMLTSPVVVRTAARPGSPAAGRAAVAAAAGT